MLPIQTNNAAVIPSLTDAQEWLRDDGQAPFPQPFDLAGKNGRYFIARRVILTPGQREYIRAGFVPTYWVAYARRGVANDGFYISQDQASNDALWVKADGSIHAPGFQSDLYVEADATNANTLELYIAATKNCDLWL